MPEGRSVLRRTTLRDRAESALRDLIVRGELAPGSRINEVALATELGISRGPLREAIGGLAREGLLEIVTHRGAFVPSIDGQRLGELYELRIALETHAIRLLERRGVAMAKAALSRLLDESESALHDGRDGYPDRLDFHRTLFQLVDNGPLSSAAAEVQTRISLARARSASNPERAREALNEHRSIVEALAESDFSAAAALLDVHLRTSYASAVAAVEEPGTRMES